MARKKRQELMQRSTVARRKRMENAKIKAGKTAILGVRIWTAAVLLLLAHLDVSDVVKAGAGLPHSKLPGGGDWSVHRG